MDVEPQRATTAEREGEVEVRRSGRAGGVERRLRPGGVLRALQVHLVDEAEAGVVAEAEGEHLANRTAAQQLAHEAVLVGAVDHQRRLVEPHQHPCARPADGEHEGKAADLQPRPCGARDGVADAGLVRGGDVADRHLGVRCLRVGLHPVAADQQGCTGVAADGDPEAPGRVAGRAGVQHLVEGQRAAEGEEQLVRAGRGAEPSRQVHPAQPQLFCVRDGVAPQRHRHHAARQHVGSGRTLVGVGIEGNGVPADDDVAEGVRVLLVRTLVDDGDRCDDAADQAVDDE